MKDIWMALENLKDASACAFETAHAQRTNFYKLINVVVSIAQEARLNKDYELSDNLRRILKESGVEIIQGTAGYDKFEDIPKHLVGRPVVDTWKFID